MPTYSAIQLDRLLDPEATSTTTTTVKTTSLNKNNGNLLEDSFPKLQRCNTTSSSDLNSSSSSRRFVDIPPPNPSLRRRNSITSSPQFNNAPARPQITPALYTTPEPTPLPFSPTSSFPPSSPFLINHKRRGPRLSKSFSDQNVAGGDDAAASPACAAADEEKVKLKRNEEIDEVSTGEGEAKGGESEDFFDPQESMSFSSSIDLEEYCAERSAKAVTPMGEFYDAWEELSSDSGRQAAQRSFSDVETELREMRLTVLMEIEKRKQAEEMVHSMRTQWQMLREKLGTAGVILPADLAVLEEGGLTEDICRQIHLARFVSESIGRGIARAKAEAELEAQLEAKNFEIARLCDRLHYYETMNREMSQRNQEAVEVARQDRQKRRRRQKWVWGSIATAITLGSAALAWSYLPGGKGSSLSRTLEASQHDSDGK